MGTLGFLSSWIHWS